MVGSVVTVKIAEVSWSLVAFDYHPLWLISVHADVDINEKDFLVLLRVSADFGAVLTLRIE